MLACLRHLLGWLMGVLRSQADLILENLALRQQLLALRAQRPRLGWYLGPFHGAVATKAALISMWRG
jgi:hypothetical protein